MTSIEQFTIQLQCGATWLTAGDARGLPWRRRECAAALTRCAIAD
jgi:hypothetical protein